MRFLMPVIIGISFLSGCRTAAPETANEKSISDASYSEAYRWTCYLIRDFERIGAGPRQGDSLNRHRVCVGNYNDNYNYVLFDDGEDKNDADVYFGTTAQNQIRTLGAVAYSVHLVLPSGGRPLQPTPLSHRPTDIFVNYVAAGSPSDMFITEKTDSGDGLKYKLSIEKLKDTNDNGVLLILKKMIAPQSGSATAVTANCGNDSAGVPYIAGDAIRFNGSCNSVCTNEGVKTARCIGNGPTTFPPAGNGCGETPSKCQASEGSTANCGNDAAGSPYQVGDAIRIHGGCNSTCTSLGVATARCIGTGPVQTPPAGNGCGANPSKCAQ